MIDSFFTQNHSTVNKYRQNFQGPAMFYDRHSHTTPIPFPIQNSLKYGILSMGPAYHKGSHVLGSPG